MASDQMPKASASQFAPSAPPVALEPPPPYSESDPGRNRQSVDPVQQVPLVPQPQPQPSQVIIVRQQVPVCFGERPVQLTCMHCNSVVLTTVNTSPSPLAYAVCLLMWCVGLWFCCCLPCCLCRKYEHSCPSCKKILGFGT